MGIYERWADQSYQQTKERIEQRSGGICEWIIESERPVDWPGSRCTSKATEICDRYGQRVPNDFIHVCAWHRLIADLMKKECCVCGEGVYNWETDAVEDAEQYFENTCYSTPGDSTPDNVGADEICDRRYCEYHEHVMSRDD
jgi:hypothetical protein